MLQGVEEESLKTWLEFLVAQPRAAQLLSEKNNALVISLYDVLSR